MIINTSFDFTTDSPGYWDDFWKKEDGRGVNGSDPDSTSRTLQNYHKLLWSRTLPNEQKMCLRAGSGAYYLTWNGMRFGSDSILASFRYKDYKWMLDRVAELVPDYKAFVEQYLREFYSIGGMIIFPKRQGGINQSRGWNPYIRDRWDRTMECIRRYYLEEDSPLFKVLKEDKQFFDLFVDFKGFVDFFFLQDCVSEDYTRVLFWEGDNEIESQPLPKTVQDYLKWISNEKEFVRKRNARIDRWIKGNPNLYNEERKNEE